MTDAHEPGPTRDPVENAPRTEGEVTRPPAIQVALVILIVFLALLALGVLWPLLNGG
jgi:hypothetical protein